MAKNKTAYLVLHGSIQDTNSLIPSGELFTPATTEHADELLTAGIIGPSPQLDLESDPDAAAKAAAEAEAAAEAKAAEEAKSAEGSSAAEEIELEAETEEPQADAETRGKAK